MKKSKMELANLEVAFEVVEKRDIDAFPIVKTGAFQPPVGGFKAEWTD